MKGYLCIVGMLCALVLVKCEPSEETKKLFQECAKEVGLAEPEGPPKGPPNFDDPKVKCAHACLMKKKGKLVDGKIMTEKIIEAAAKHIPGGVSDAFKAIINECTTKANEEKEECDVAASFNKCMMEKHQKKQ